MTRRRSPPKAVPRSRQTVPDVTPWTVYILCCADETLYTGCTNNVPRRLRRHAAGQVRYTRGRLPVALAYQEAVADHSAALRREAAIKRLSRRQKLQLCATGLPTPRTI